MAQKNYKVDMMAQDRDELYNSDFKLSLDEVCNIFLLKTSDINILFDFSYLHILLQC